MINCRAKFHLGLTLLAVFLSFGSMMLHAQGSNMQISIKKSNLTIKEAFQEIEKQTNLSVAYNQSKLDDSQKISLNETNKSLGEVLSIILKDTEFSYELKGDQIMIVPKRSTQQQLPENIKGEIVDDKGEPIIGASILVKGTTTGTITDMDGVFTIPVNIGQTLTISFVGFLPQNIVVKDKTPLFITLTEDSKLLDEVVVTALGIKREEKALSYNVQQVTSEDLTTVKNANFVNSLAGKVAGVQINSSSSGPGSAAKIVMRGAKSLTLSNNALYVIDGVPMNSKSGIRPTTEEDSSMSSISTTDGIADINPEDIESLSVLTGPSAAALYGYEGANGVVLITTKKGSAGKTTLTYSHSTTFSNPMMMPEFQNTYGNNQNEVTSWGDLTSRRFSPKKFFNTGTNLVNALSLSTGTDKNQSYLSIAATNASGIMPNNDYDRYNFTFRNTHKFLEDKLTLNTSFSYIMQKDKNMVGQGQYFNPLPALYLFPRGEDFDAVRLYEHFDSDTQVLGQYWPYGDQELSIQNPYWIMYNMDRITNRKRYMASASLQYDVTDWLNLVGRVNIDNTNTRFTDKRKSGTHSTFAGMKGRFKRELIEDRQTYADFMANIKKTIDKFSFHINLGASIKDTRGNYEMMEGDLVKATNWFTIENIQGSGNYKVDADAYKQQVQSIFGSAEIGYNHFLYLTMTARNDWDSALHGEWSDTKSFFYPSVGLSGLISEVVSLPKWFTYLKARATYTSVGMAYRPYLTDFYLKYNPQTIEYEAEQYQRLNKFKPEITNSYEFGLNMRFFNNKLSLDATYYYSKTKNQTHEMAVPGSTAAAKYIIQAGDVQNKGVEVALGYENSWNDFSWSTSYTFNYNKNKVNSLVKGAKDPLTGANLTLPEVYKATLGSQGSPIVLLREGGTMGDIYSTTEFKRDNNGYIYLDPSTQLPSIVNIENTKDMKKIGSLLPNSHMGWHNSFSYKGLRLNILLSGRFGGKVVSNTQAILDRYGVSKNSAYLRETEGISVTGRKISAKDFLGIIGEGTGKSDYYVYDATNIRLQEVSIEYTIPKKWVNNLANITIGLVGNNLGMIYCKAPFDPEVTPSASSSFYQGVDYFMQPSLRNMGFSLKVQF